MAIVAITLYFVVGAVALTLRYAVIPHIDAFRPRIEALASRAVGAPVHIGRLSARWQSRSPEFALTDLTIDATPHASDAAHGSAAGETSGAPDAADAAGLHVRSVHAVVAWRSLLRFKPLLASLEIDGADVRIRRHADGTIDVAGVTLRHRGGNPYGFSNWLLAQRAIVVRNTSVQWQDDQHPTAAPLKLDDIRFALLNSGRQHRAGLQGRFDDAALGTVDIRSEFTHRFGSALRTVAGSGIGDPHQWTGELYAASGSVDLPALAQFLPLPIAAVQGNVKARAWTHFDAGRISRVDGDLDGAQLGLRVRSQSVPLELPHVGLAFSTTLDDGDYRATFRRLRVEMVDRSALEEASASVAPDAAAPALIRMLDVDRFDAEYRAPKLGRGERITLAGDVLDIGLLADFTHALPLPQRIKRNIERYDPRGVLADYRLEWERAPPATPEAVAAARQQGDQPLQRYEIHAVLQGVSLAAQAPAPGLTPSGHPRVGQPGFDNLQGRIDANEAGGQLALASQDASLTVRGMFDAPTLHFDTLSGQVNWKLGHVPDARQPSKQAATLDATTNNIAFSNADVAGTVVAGFHTALPSAPLGRLDIDARLSRANVASVTRYLPTSINEKVRLYLAHALKAGAAHDVRISAHGRLPDLPFPHGPEMPGIPHEASNFSVSAPFDNGTIDLSPTPAVYLANGDAERWPSFDGIAGRFFVEGRKLGFDVDTGRYRGVRVASIAGRIDDLSNLRQPMDVSGVVRGPLDDMLSYVNDSPLAFWSRHISDQVHAEGSARLALHLRIPRQRASASAAPSASAVTSMPPPVALSNTAQPQTRSRPAAAIGVEGTLDFDDNQITRPGIPALDRVTGSVAFTNRTITADSVRGRWLGGKLDAGGKMLADGSIDVRVDGDVAPAAAAAAAGVPAGLPRVLLQRLTGSTAYRATWQRAGHGASEIAVTSNLRGLAIDAPAPFGKPADAALPFAVKWRELSAAASNAGNTSIDGNARANARPGLTVNARANGRARADDDGESNAAGSDISGNNATDETTDDPSDPAMLRNPKQLPQRLDLTAGPLRAVYLRRGGAVAGSVTGAIAVGRAPVLPPSGVVASLALDRLDADAWRDVIASVGVNLTDGGKTPSAAMAPSSSNVPSRPGMSDMARNNDAAPAASAPSPWLPDRFDLTVGDTALLSRHWTHLSASGQRNAARGWEGHIDSDQISGTLEWQPQGGSALHGRFTKVLVPETDPALVRAAAARTAQAARVERGTPPNAPHPIRHYPAIDLIAERFSVGRRDAGRLELLAHNVQNGDAPLWEVDKLMLSNPAANLTATGSWRTSEVAGAPASPQFDTALDFTLALKDGGALFDRLGFPNTLQGGTGTVAGVLHWQGSPGSIDAATLAGHVNADIHNGQILKVNPGAARLLGVLSAQGLARYLQLDFKGLFGKGLAFSRLSGSTEIAGGVATTQNFALQTTPARVSATGEANLADKTLHFGVTVVPHVNAASASIAAAVVNPLLGLGTLAAQMALSEPISRSLSRRYDISGSWSAPHVERTDGNHGTMP